MEPLRTTLDQLNPRELEFVIQRSKTDSDHAAYISAGIAKSTWFKKDSEHRSYLVDLAFQLKHKRTIQALMILDENAEEAAKVLANLLDAESETVQLNAAKDILDRTTGKPAQKVDNTHAAPNGGAIKHEHSTDDITTSILSKLAGIAATNGAGGVSEESDPD